MYKLVRDFKESGIYLLLSTIYGQYFAYTIKNRNVMIINFKNALKILGLTILLFIFICIPYYLQFREFGISRNTASWGEYGSYIAGVSSVLNLVIFVYLTIYVARLGNLNNKTQIITQKKIIISQFRQTELEKLSDQLDQAFTYIGMEEKESIIFKFSNSAKYLTNFMNQKKYLFPIIENQDIQTNVENILNKHNQFIGIIEEIFEKPNLPDELQTKLYTKIQATAYLKNDLIEKLQMYIINELGE